MRVLIVGTGLFEIPPSRGGGVETHMYNIGRLLADRGKDVHIVGSRGAGNQSGIVYHQVIPVKASFGSGFYGWLRNFFVGSAITILSVILIRDRRSFHVVHLHDAVSGTFILVFRKLLFDQSRIVFTRHGYQINSNTIRYNGLKREVMLLASALVRYVMQHADRVIVFSETQYREVLALDGVRKDQLRIVRQSLGIGSKQLSEGFVSKTLGRYRLPERYCLFVGRLGGIKGVKTLLYALQGTEIRCVIVGGGSLEKWTNLAKKLNLSVEATFAGVIPNSDELRAIYQSAEFFILPTLGEGFPIVVLEAMACGLPVVCTNVSGLSEVVEDGRSGYLVPPHDYVTLRQKALLLWKEEPLRQNMGQNALQTIQKKYNEHVQAQALIAAYAS